MIREVWSNGVLIESIDDGIEPDPPMPTDAERIAELEAILAALLGDTP